MSLIDYFGEIFEKIKSQSSNIINDLGCFEDKGSYGETLTESKLNSYGISGRRVVFRNLLVPYHGKTVEIDLMMIHEKGIFVFESKNYSGWIFGSADQLKWTQSLSSGEKYRFYNPIMQNQTHIKALSEKLKLPTTYFFSYIVFSERCELKAVPDNTEQVSIVRRHKLLKRLSQQLDTLPELYSPMVLDSIADIIKEYANNSRAEYKAHADRVHEQMNSDICPLCRSKLILKNGKHGSFWGCSSYPRCHYTRDL